MRAKKTSISLVTYNVLHFPTIPYITAKNYYKLERLKAIAAQLAPFDIACIQEMYRPLSENLDPFLAHLKRAGFEYFYMIDINGIFSTYLSDGGTMIISKFQIIHGEQQIWPRGIKQDGQCLKGGVYSQLKLPNGAVLHLVNVHVQATYGFDESETKMDTVHMRQEQFRVLKNWVIGIFDRVEIANEDLFILCGDFNTDALCMNPEIKQWLESIEFEDETGDPADLERVRQSKNLHSFFINYMQYNNLSFTIEDVFYRHHKTFPITFAATKIDKNGKRVPVEQYLTDEVEFLDEMTLDYIFQLIPHKQTRPTPPQSKLEIIDNSAKIEKFEHKIKGTPLTHLSDHFGLSIRLQLN